MFDRHLEAALTSAVAYVQSRRHEYLTLEHLLLAITEQRFGEELLEACGVDVLTLQRRLKEFFRTYMSTLPDGAAMEVVQTLAVQRVMQRSVRQMHAAGKEHVGIGDVLLAMLDEEESHAAFFMLSLGLSRITLLEVISHANPYDAAEGKENTDSSEDAEAEQNDKEKKLAQSTTDLTEKARQGLIDPLIGRNAELTRTVHVLSRRRKNNPLFVGDPGVGKTALAEGLALRIVNGEVPPAFKEARVFALDMGALLAGSKYRGDFEARLKAVVSALQSIPDSIMVIDEIHTIVGAGATSGGSMDASNILKPVLASGKLRCIGSTTHEEYRNHFEKDRALSRRFQKIDINEPTEEECVDILKGLKSHYESHHGVRYTSSALRAAVTLSVRHLRDKLLPDKAIDVLDEAGAARQLVQSRFSGTAKAGVPLTVGVAEIEKVVAAMARIPSAKVSTSDRDKLRTLEEDLRGVVFGQDKAVELVSKAVLRARAGFTRQGRPQGSFLFYGPTGVGKTELARQLAASLQVSFLRYDMSEYMEKHAVSRLIGAPPGYVGFDQGGLLTEAVRKTPHCVLLLDEIEKAHPDIFNILLQVMDYATLTDNTGRNTDFRNAVLIMTSNAGAFEISARSIGFGAASSGAGMAEKGLKAVEKLFSPEFRNRLDAMVPFAGLSPTVMSRIVDKFIAELVVSLKEKRVHMTVTEAARNWLAVKGYDPAFGARPLARVLRQSVEDELAKEVLFGHLAGGGNVTVDAGEDEKQGLLFHYEAAAGAAGKPLLPPPPPVKKAASGSSAKASGAKKAGGTAKASVPVKKAKPAAKAVGKEKEAAKSPGRRKTKA